MHALGFLAASIYLITTATTTGAQKCYFPDGTEAGLDTPCQAPQPGQASPCCNAVDVCLDNKLCLPQTGNHQLVWRGSCTDQSWQSGDCPQHCQDVATDGGAPIFPFILDTDYCCGPGNCSSGKCKHSTRGSLEPFPVNVGRVIFNKTSGSTSPNVSDTSIVTITLSSGTALPTIGADSSNSTIRQSHDTSPSSSKETAVGVGLGVPCGLALLGAMGLLWRQRTRERDARREARDWEEKFNALANSKQGVSIGIGNYTQELEHKGWRPDEIDGRLVHEAPDGT